MALMANCNRNPKEQPKPFQPRDFLPPMYCDPKETAMKTPDEEVPPAAAFALFKSMYVKEDGP